MDQFREILQFIRQTFHQPEAFIPLHAPVFSGNEKKYLAECIDTTYVSYVGEFVVRFEEMIRDYTGSAHAIAVVNGTCALHVALLVAGVRPGEEVLTQTLTFVATSNAIAYTQANLVYIDSEKEYLGMCPDKLDAFLSEFASIRDDGQCYNKKTGNRIAACVPVHIFGHPCRIDRIMEICDKWHIPVIEDAAESLGGTFKGKHTGTFGKAGILSFNGNKTITTGGGGMIITHDEAFANRAKHITTTAKVPHPYEFFHDELGYNYRMTNVNAAIGCAQMEKLDEYIQNKRELAMIYADFFSKIGIPFFTEKSDCHSNYWLNVIFLKDRKERDAFLNYSNEHKVMTRPAWTLMNKLPMYQKCLSTDLHEAQWLENRMVNIPSSVRF